NQGSAFPSLDEISRGTGIARRHVPAIIHEIEKTKLLLISHSDGGRGHSTVYHFGDEANVRIHGDVCALETSPPTGRNVPTHGTKTSPPTGTESKRKRISDFRRK